MGDEKETTRDGLHSQSAAPSISDVILTPDEEAFLDPEFLREAVSGAIEAVQQRNVGIARLLGMRDLLFATWLRRTFKGSEHGSNDASVESGIERLQSEVANVLRDTTGEIELPQALQAVTRVTEFAAARDLNVAKYLSFVDASVELPNGLDDQLRGEMEALMDHCM